MLTECRPYRRQIVELARGKVGPDERRGLLAHTSTCSDCAQALDGQVALSAAMQDMTADALPEMGHIEALVLAEFDRSASRRKRARVQRWIAIAGIAAALLMAVILREWRPAGVRAPAQVETAVDAPVPVPTTPPVEAAAKVPRRPVQRIQRVTQTGPTEEEQPFLAIPYTVPPGPEERTTVVRMEIPVAALIAAGYTVAVTDPGAVVEADVLLSQDGRARAIRPISVLASR